MRQWEISLGSVILACSKAVSGSAQKEEKNCRGSYRTVDKSLSNSWSIRLGYGRIKRRIGGRKAKCQVLAQKASEGYIPKFQARMCVNAFCN